MAAGLLMYEGAVVEMNAGEGKTVAGAFPAALHALNGAVHVATANDYLAARDADTLAPVFETLGLSVGRGAVSDARRRTRQRLPPKHRLWHAARVRIRLPAG